MRPLACALLTILLVIGTCGDALRADETGFWRWPFGQKDTTQAAASAAAPVPTTGQQSRMSATTALSGTTTPGAAPSSYAQSPLPQAATTGTPNQHWMYESPTSRVSWPRIHMPEFSLPKPRLPRPQLSPREQQVNEARNAWVQESPNPDRPSPLQAMKQGAQRVGDSTRRAWHTTVDVLTPGGSTSPASSRIARRQSKPPFWKRMFASEEPQNGPRTITEWMAQERLDP